MKTMNEMSKRSSLKTMALAGLAVSAALALSSAAKAVEPTRQNRGGGASGVGGGGDPMESRVDEIRADILKWISEGGAQALILPAGMSHEYYRVTMTSVLVPHAVTVSFVTTAQESASTEPESVVSVDGVAKTCRGFVSRRDGRPHILCNTERFSREGDASQYRLIHHEYAGLAGVESNRGASSDYAVSNQLTAHLESTTVLRLAVRKARPAAPPSIDALISGLAGSYRLAGQQVIGADSCPKKITLRQTSVRALDITLSEAYLAENFLFDENGNGREPGSGGGYGSERCGIKDAMSEPKTSSSLRAKLVPQEASVRLHMESRCYLDDAQHLFGIISPKSHVSSDTVIKLLNGTQVQLHRRLSLKDGQVETMNCLYNRT